MTHSFAAPRIAQEASVNRQEVRLTVASRISSRETAAEEASSSTGAGSAPPVDIEAGLLTGGQDRHYAFGLATALVLQGVSLDVVGSDEIDSPELHFNSKINFLNLRGEQKRDVTLAQKMSRVLIYYASLIRYAATARPKILHILWNNKFEFVDRTLLMLYYRILGKKVVVTAHNVNAARRDLTDTVANRLTLRAQYRLADHIFVHTTKMKSELVNDFGVRDGAITVIPYGINNAVPSTDLSPRKAKEQLSFRDSEKAILFFGAITPYKGLEFLVSAFQHIADKDPDYRLIIAGRPEKGRERYMEEIQQTISQCVNRNHIIQKLSYIPDSEIELYFKAADLLVLPYTQIFQSGILFLGFSFGLPAVATDIGSFGEDIIENKTGFLCKPGDPVDLGRTIDRYFKSELYKNRDRSREEIRQYANARHGWDVVARMTRNVYGNLLL